MRKRLYLAGIALLLILIGLGVWEWVRTEEPMYKGERLSIWVKNGAGGNYLEEAVRGSGTNAIPVLLRMLRTKDSGLEVKINSLERRLGLTRRLVIAPEAFDYRISYAFGVLGTNACAAAPELIRIADEKISPTSQACAIESLGYVALPTKENVSAFLRWGTNSSSRVRGWARAGLQRVDPEAAEKAIETNYWRQ